MKNCYTSLSIHEGSGTSQNERWNPALSTNFFLLDERKEEDFILFVQKLAEFVNYYDFSNLQDGNWKAFFENESTTVIISIAHWNIDALQNQYDILLKKIKVTANPSDQKNLLKEYFSTIQGEFDKFIAKVGKLDDAITAKESLTGSALNISNLLNSIISDIQNTTLSIPQFLDYYTYTKKLQQLFGLLSSWRNYAESAIESQLSNYDKHQPHYALLLTFLKLLNLAKDKLNEFTKNHLDYYYKNILRTQNQNAEPDYVHLTIEPFKGKPFLLPAQTIFPAGKNTSGQAKYYASTVDATINNITLNAFSTYHFEEGKYYKVADLLQGNGSGKGFSAFQQNKEEFKEGILIASPLFFLQSGDRFIYLRFNGQNIDAQWFQFYITGEKKTIEITNAENKKSREHPSEKYIRLSIPNTEKAIVPLDKKLHPEIFADTEFPVLKIVPKDTSVLPFIKTIDIEVKVENFTSYTIDSDFGTIDIKKPFYPFGETPKSGNGIFVSSAEFAMKKNAVAEFFTDDDGWFYSRVNLYKISKGIKEYYSGALTQITNTFAVTDYDFKAISSENKIRIELNSSEYVGETYMKNYIDATGKLSKGTDATLPYKPKINDFTFNYSVKETVNLFYGTEKNQSKIFIINPFGFQNHSINTLKFSDFKNNEGYIYLGFGNVNAKDSLNFLIQLEEGTANPLLPPAKIKWEYLSVGSWNDFKEGSMGDETFSLTQSGIISINLPDFDLSKNTELSSAFFWMRIQVSDVRAICNFLGVHVQAVKAVLTDYEKKGTYFTEITPKGSISKSLKAINGVKKVNHPYASFGGRRYEEDEHLYQRTSERLRHKNRAITSWDYEHILLQEFPEIHRVKTLNHFRYDSEISNVSAGYVTIIPIAKSAQNENVNWKPLLSLNKMQKVKSLLEKICSPHVRLNVKPPKPERVELSFKVKFFEKPGADIIIYKKLLAKTINEFLSPWAFDLEQAEFAQNIEFSTMIKLIDNQPYVDFLTDFSVKQYLLDENYNVIGNPIKNLSKITPQTDFSLFIPTEDHLITDV